MIKRNNPTTATTENLVTTTCACDIWGSGGGGGNLDIHQICCCGAGAGAAGAGGESSVLMPQLLLPPPLPPLPSSSTHHQLMMPGGIAQPHPHQQQPPSSSSSFPNNNTTTSALSSTSNSIPMEFIQVLIHQHAKTLVALQSLEKEVKTLKIANRNTKIVTSSLSSPLHNHHAHLSSQLPPFTHHTHTPHHHHHHNANNVNLATPQKPDSGFTERYPYAKSEDSASGQSEDELFSLLSLIQCKVEKTLLKSNTTLKQSTRENLGHLDSLLGNSSYSFDKGSGLSKEVLRGVLACGGVVELKRQLLFSLGRVESLKTRITDLESQLECSKTMKRRQITSPPPLLPPQPQHPQQQQQQIKSINSSLSSNNKSLIPVPIRSCNKKKIMLKESDKDSSSVISVKKNKFLWGQWFNGYNNNNNNNG